MSLYYDLRVIYKEYNQAVKMAKAGTIEALAYDVITGVIECIIPFGISFIVTYWNAYSRTKDKKMSLIEALKAGSIVFGTSLFEHVFISELARTELFRDILDTPLKSRIAFSTVSFGIHATKDIYKLCRKKISVSQFYLNSSKYIGSVVGSLALGAAGAKIGASIGSKCGVIGSVIGGFAGGVGGGIGVSTINKLFIEDDRTVFMRLFNAYIPLLAYEYLFSEEEMNSLMEKLDKKANKDMKTMIINYLSSKNQDKTIRSFLEPICDEIAASRPKLELKMA